MKSLILSWDRPTVMLRQIQFAARYPENVPKMVQLATAVHEIRGLWTTVCLNHIAVVCSLFL